MATGVAEQARKAQRVEADFTVFGGAGFIGSRLVEHLQCLGRTVHVPSRDEISSGAVDGRHLGHVIYAIGLTGDFRDRPSETIEAHVGLLDRLVNATRWESWLYVSSTRVYGAGQGNHPKTEDAAISVTPSADGMYDISKLLGEALVLARLERGCRVARVSNVVGAQMSESTFLGSIVEQARRGEPVTIREHPASRKDYIVLDTAVKQLAEIALAGQSRVYNVASGAMLEHRALAEMIERIFSVPVRFAANAPKRRMPQIDVSRHRAEFGEGPADVAQDIEKALAAMR